MKIFKNFKHIFFIIAISLTLVFVMTKYLFADFLVPINYFFTYRTGNDAPQDIIYAHKSEPSKNIVMIEIDEKTINELMSASDYSMLTIGKTVYAEVVENLKRLGAKSIGFDIIFQNPDTEENEKKFLDAMLDAWNVVIGTIPPTSKNNQISTETIDNCSGNHSDIYSLICPNTPRAIYNKIRWGELTTQTGRNNSAAYRRELGYNITESPMQSIIKFGNENIHLQAIDGFVFTLPIAMLASENHPAIEKWSREIIANKWKNKTLLMQPYFHEKNYSKNEKPYISISLIDFYNNPDVFSNIIKDSYIFIGEAGDTIHDTFISPVTWEKIAGVYSHAFMLDSILQNKILKEANATTVYIIAIVLTIIFVGIYFILPKYIAPFFMIISLTAIVFVARYSYDQLRIVFDIFPFLLASGIITFPITYIYKFFIVEKDKRLIMNAFSRYLSPSVVEMIDANKIDATLGGEKKELSILFSDIAGFTTISEKLDTKELFVVMTKYLSEMTEVLVDNKWTLDKYIGDAVMGFFGAPVDDDFHAVNACKTALAMRAKLGDFNKWLVSKWHETIDFRVGIATGEVLVGNIGSERQFNYTVLGDVVNLASRLEGTGKEYGVNIIIASSTRLASGDGFLVRELDYIAVKWKNEGVRIYELVGTLGDNINMTPYTTYESALRLYRDGKYMDAGRVWESLATTDKPSEIMMHRCVALIKWEMSLENGIYKMTHK